MDSDTGNTRPLQYYPRLDSLRTQRTQALWHRRLARSAVNSASSEEAIRTGAINLRVPKITPLVLNTPAPAYLGPSEPVETDIQSRTSSPTPDFDTLEGGPRYLDYTPYVPTGLEVELFDEPYLGDFDFFDPGEDIRRHFEVVSAGNQLKTIELLPDPNCNFAYYGLLPPNVDPGPTATVPQDIKYPPCDSADCRVIENSGVIVHSQGPYQDPSIPPQLHGYLSRSLEAHGLRDLFQSGSIPPPEVWDALNRILDGTAAMINGPPEEGISDWAMVESFRAWHCFGHRSVEEWYDDMLSTYKGADDSGDEGSETDGSDDEEDARVGALAEATDFTVDEVLFGTH